MESNILKWNFANWLTVVLMTTIAYTAFSAAVSFVKSKQGG